MNFDTTSLCSLVPHSLSSVVISSDVPTQIENSHGVIFRRSDKVRVAVSPEVLEMMQENHGGYNRKMADFCYKIGYVHRITVSGDLRVKFGPNSDSPRFTYNPDVLELIYLRDDMVQVIDDGNLIKEIHEREGLDETPANEIASKSGQVRTVRPERVQVLIGNKYYWISNRCLILQESCSSALTTILRKNCPYERYSRKDGPLVTLSESEVKRVRELTRQMEDILDTFTCIICFERLRKIAFLCGHGACRQCSNELSDCPMCREQITRKIELF